MVKKEVFWATSTLVGWTIGAGILGLPYVIAKAGFSTGLISMIAIALLVLYINLGLGEITLRTKGNHQIVYLTRKYLGKKVGKVMLSVSIVSMYGALSAYTIGSGSTFTAIFGGSRIIASLIFLGILATVLFYGINVLKRSELLLTSVMIMVILGLFAYGFGDINASNLNHLNISKVYLPFGVLLFAFSGLGAMPEMKEELKDKRLMKKAIILSSIIVTAVYVAFATLCIGISGQSTTEVATIGLGQELGKGILIFGNLFALFAMATSFIAIGYALKEIYHLDMGLDRLISWLLVISFPLIILMLNLLGFIQLLNYTGAITGTITSIIVLQMFLVAKKHGERKPEYEIKSYPLLIWLITILFVAAAAMIIFRF